jgi:hypothetical protein
LQQCALVLAAIYRHAATDLSAKETRAEIASSSSTREKEGEKQASKHKE